MNQFNFSCVYYSELVFESSSHTTSASFRKSIRVSRWTREGTYVWCNTKDLNVLTVSTCTHKSSRGLVLLLNVLNPTSNIFFRARGDIKLPVLGNFLILPIGCAIEIPFVISAKPNRQILRYSPLNPPTNTSNPDWRGSGFETKTAINRFMGVY